MQEISDDLELFYENINFDLVDPLEKPSPSGTINLKYVFPLSTEVREKKKKGSDEVEIICEAATGGQKKIYKSRLVGQGVLLALAFMKDSTDLDEVEAFLRQAAISRSLKHPSIVETYDCGIDETYGPYMVMPWIEGDTLHEVLKNLRHGAVDYTSQFPLARLLTYFREICQAVSYAHSRDVIHLDLKPENVLINYLTDHAFLADWGLAQSFSPIGDGGIDPVLLNADQGDGILRGTPGYMSPEQIMENKLDVRTDIYQLGGILYAIIFHHCPVGGDDINEVLNKTLKGEIYVDEINKDILPYIGICKKAMDVKPDNRYSTVSEIIRDLDRISLTREIIEEKKSHRLKLNLLICFSAILVICSLTLFYHVIFNTNEGAFEIEDSAPQPQVNILEGLEKVDKENPETVKTAVPVWYTYIEEKLKGHPLLELRTEEVTAVPDWTREAPVILAPGPLAGRSLTASVETLLGEGGLAFFDAISL